MQSESIATPDKVVNTLNIYKRRANIVFAALQFIAIQIIVIRSLLVGPTIKAFTGVDVTARY